MRPPARIGRPWCVLGPDQNGFTLLEVLVALIILGLSIALVANAVSDSLARSERTAEQNRAAVLADTLLAELGTTIPVRPERISQWQDRLNWKMAVTPAPEAGSDVSLMEVNLVIYTQSGRQIGRWRTLRIATQ